MSNAEPNVEATTEPNSESILQQKVEQINNEQKKKERTKRPSITDRMKKMRDSASKPSGFNMSSMFAQKSTSQSSLMEFEEHESVVAKYEDGEFYPAVIEKMIIPEYQVFFSEFNKTLTLTDSDLRKIPRSPPRAVGSKHIRFEDENLDKKGSMKITSGKKYSMNKKATFFDLNDGILEFKDVEGTQRSLSIKKCTILQAKKK